MFSEKLCLISKMIREERNCTILLDTPPSAVVMEATAAFDPTFAFFMPCRVVSMMQLQYSHGFSMKTQDCDMFDLIYLYKGSVVVRTVQQEQKAAAGDILFLHTNMKYSIRQVEGEPLELLIIRNHGFVCNSYYELLMQGGFHPISLQNDLEFPTLVERIRFYLSYSTNANSFLVADAMNRMYTNLYISDARLERSDNQYRHPDWFLQVIDFVEQNYKKKITVTMLAEIVGMSESHFHRKFKEYTGASPVEYINLIRIRQAEQLLARTDMQVKRIALESGFSNVSYFVTQFQRQHHMTPTQYRNRMR